MAVQALVPRDRPTLAAPTVIATAIAATTPAATPTSPSSLVPSLAEEHCGFETSELSSVANYEKSSKVGDTGVYSISLKLVKAGLSP